MSSPRPSENCNGIVCQRAAPLGPIRLPERASEAFVREFNRTYARIGMSAQPASAHPRTARAAPQAAPQAAPDAVDDEKGDLLG